MITSSIIWLSTCYWWIYNSYVYFDFGLVMNNYQAAAAAAQGFGPPASPHTTTTRGGFPATNSPGPTIDMYSSSAADSVGYVQAASPQPSGYPTIAVSRAPLNYSPVSKSILIFHIWYSCSVEDDDTYSFTLVSHHFIAFSFCIFR